MRIISFGTKAGSLPLEQVWLSSVKQSFTIEAPTIPKKRHQQRYKKPTSNKPNKTYNEPNKTPLSRAEININNSILKGTVKRVINYKQGSKNNNISYVYYPKRPKEYESILPWKNKKTSEYQVKVFDKKCASVTNHYSINEYVPTADPVTASVLYANSVTSSVTTENCITVYVPSDYPITASVPTEKYVTASVPSVNTVTSSFPTDNYAPASVPTNYHINESVPNDNHVTAYVPSANTITTSLPTENYVTASVPTDYPTT